jgi:hypothetical protein
MHDKHATCDFFFSGFPLNTTAEEVAYTDWGFRKPNAYYCFFGHFYIRKHNNNDNINNSVALVCERTVTTERLLLVGEVSANFCG